MTLTPAIKGQITKAIKTAANKFTAARSIFEKHMPREQAKHAARKYLGM